MALFSRGMLPGNRTPGSLRNCECTFFFFCASAWQGALFVYGLTLNWIYSFSFLSHWLFQRLQVSVNLWTVLFFPVSGDFVETNQGFSLKFLTNYLTFTQYIVGKDSIAFNVYFKPYTGYYKKYIHVIQKNSTNPSLQRNTTSEQKPPAMHYCSG